MSSSGSKMLTKFESKSSRAKGIAFHPKRSWVLVSLHSSTIQLWDYRMGTLIDRFEEHAGPVRGIDFHKTQPLFVSGGDDYKIKVWSHETRRCLFTLTGHLDYVRTVFFHHEYPWIVSSSDDQTIRIWNWQNRSLICTLTGHNHYVMCAQFHPKEDLIVSASLDQSVRVWDISGLRKKHSSAPTMMSFEDQFARTNPNQTDVFGNTDAVVKFVLEGHDRGVNWVAFHPTLPLIASAGDDRVVKLWRMSETKAWEVDTCRGHFQNVSACLFHPHQDLIISVGEDKTIRVWDLNKRTLINSFKRENDRFWVIAAHPEINLFAAGHDNGVMVFKLERERPASAVHQNQLFYINKDKEAKIYDFTKGQESPALLSLKKLGNLWTPMRTLSYNPSERSILVTSAAEGGIYELVSLPRDAGGALEPTDSKRGAGQSAIFVARNRFAVLTKTPLQIEIKDLTNTVTKVLTPPAGTSDIYFGGTGNLLLITPTSVVLYDIQQKKQIAEVQVSGVKYIVWSNDGLHAALLSKHNVTIVTKNLQQVSTLHETIRIKSATWDDSGVLLYSTLNHVKYSLMNGDTGIVCTLDQTVYLQKVKGRSLYSLDRSGKPRIITIDPTEFRFKLALVNRNYDEMLSIIQTSSLVGQSVISYLQKKGYPEIALQFVQDPQTRFDLGLECGNIEVASQMAKELDKPQLWQKLGSAALLQGNHQVVEAAYQRLRSFDKLSFLYLLTGDRDKLRRMAQIAERRGDPTSRFQNLVFLGDVEARIEFLKELDLYPLAYLLAKSHDLEEECQSILAVTGKTEASITLPKLGSPVPVPTPIVPTFRQNWPTKDSPFALIDSSLLQPAEEGENEEEEGGLVEDESAGESEQAEEDEDGGSGWDLGEDDLLTSSDFVNIETSEEFASGGESSLWVHNSAVAADHVAGGSFSTAMQLLQRQVGAVNFAPLESRFMEIYAASRTFLPAMPGLPPLVNHVRRTLDTAESNKVLPAIPRNLEYVQNVMIPAGFKAMDANKLEDGVRAFRNILQVVMLNVAQTEDEEEEANRIIQTSAQYALAMTLELEQRKVSGNNRDLSALSGEDKLRALQLSAYFTVPELSEKHGNIALFSAMNLAFKNKQLKSASYFANTLLQRNPNSKFQQTATGIVNKCKFSLIDEVGGVFDPTTPFFVCGASYTPIAGNDPCVFCPYDKSKFHVRYKGKVCPICEVAQIGATVSGLRLKP